MGRAPAARIERPEGDRDARPAGRDPPMTNLLLDAPARRPAPADIVEDRTLAAALRRERPALAARLFEHVAAWDAYPGHADLAAGADHSTLLAREFHAYIDYLALLLETGDPTYKSLYVGEKTKQLYSPGAPADALRDLRRRVAEADAAAILAHLAGQAPGPALNRLEALLVDIARVLGATAKHARLVLFVGDCLYVDTTAFLVAAALEDDIQLNIDFAASKNRVELHRHLRELAGREYDLVFVSPFTYDFSPEYASLANWRKGFLGRRALGELSARVIDEAAATLDVVASLFECPVFVHNSSNIRRHDGSPAERLKNRITLRARSLARGPINEWLPKYIQQKNKSTFEHLHLVDELPISREHGEAELGRYFYNSDLQHPAVMGKHVAALYRDLIAVDVNLGGKKLVVADLDNTLWEGEIGEGEVVHHLDRQETLKALSRKGVVLAVNSKNDPGKVHWRGAALSADDFVNMQINWEPKAANMRRIREALNLKYKDYVFVDDRGDQREMVQSAYPEMCVLDATDPRTWRLMRLWADLLPSQGEADRTQLYREREAREGFLEAEVAEEDQASQFAKLGIKVHIRRARGGDVKRVVELINRTNQYNLRGSRTSFREASEWNDAPGRTILVADAADKFGQMGMVCAAFVERGEAGPTIPVFVQSCRVIGYAIERSLLNAVKRSAAGKSVVGLYAETPHNGPCRSMYADNGFQVEGGGWIYRGQAAPEDAPWLSVVDESAAGPGR